MNGVPLSPPESPMAMSPELPPKKTLPTSPDDEVGMTDEEHPPSTIASAKSVEKPAIIHDLFKSPPPRPETSARPGPSRTLHTTENPGLNAKTAPLPAPTTNVFTPLPPPTDIPGTRLMRKASAPQLQPNVPTFGRDPVSQPTPALPKRTSWLTKAREVHQEAKTLTHTKRTEPQPGPSEPSTATTNNLTKSTKRKPSEIFDGVVLPLRQSGKVQKVTETDVQTNAIREQHEREKKEKEKGKERENDFQQDPYSDFDILDEEDALHTLKRTVEGLGSRAGKSMGRSIGGLAAAALAEARATAEARIAEKTEKLTVIEPKPKEPGPRQSQGNEAEPTNSDSHQQPPKEKSPIPQPASVRSSLHNKERVFQPPSQADVIKLKAHKDDTSKANDLAQPSRSISKPPPVHQPVFSKPVFTAPKPKPMSPKPPTITNVGLQPSFSNSSDNRLEDAPAPTAWLLENQENRDRDDHDDHTAFTTALYDTQNELGGPGSDLDEGDSWHDGDKLNPIWSALNFDGAQRDDETTWSTIPTQNHTSSTQGFHTNHTGSSTGTGHKTTKSREEKEKESLEILGLTKPEAPLSPPKEDEVLEEENGQEPPREVARENGDILMEVGEAEESMKVGSDKVGIPPWSSLTSGQLTNRVAAHGSTFNLPRRTALERFQNRRWCVRRQEGKDARPSEEFAIGCFDSQEGVLCQPNEPARILFTATQQKEEEEKVARVKETELRRQEEEEKKLVRMKEMELRRQQVGEKKAEEEKARQAEEEQKAKLEAEKRKREKEEDMSKKLSVKPPTTKKVSRNEFPSL